MNARISTLVSAVLLAVPLSSAHALPQGMPPSETPPARPTDPRPPSEPVRRSTRLLPGDVWATQLRLGDADRSTGVPVERWKIAGESRAIQNAQSHHVCRLADGSLVALASVATGEGVDEVGLRIATSKDAGVTWSALRSVNIEGLPGNAMPIGEPTLVSAPSGGESVLRMYFEAGPVGRRALHAASSRDGGASFVYERRVGITSAAGSETNVEGERVPATFVARLGDQWVMVQQGLVARSQDGLKFEADAKPPQPCGSGLGSMISINGKLLLFRAGSLSRDGNQLKTSIDRFESSDGVAWKPLSAIDADGGRRPAIAALPDGSLLLLSTRASSGKLPDRTLPEREPGDPKDPRDPLDPRGPRVPKPIPLDPKMPPGRNPMPNPEPLDLPR